MKIGVPKDTARHEHRIGLTPFGVSRLTAIGCEVFVERQAGEESRFADEDFVKAGAKIVHSADEAYGRADIVCKVGTITSDEVRMMAPGAAVCGFMHMAVMPRETIAAIAEREITVLGWETVEDGTGSHPVLRAISEIAGHMAVHEAASLLKFESGGRGIVLGNIPGVPPPTFLILGAGVVGWTAARTALACGAHVIMMDADLEKLRRGMEHGCAAAVTTVATRRNLERYAPIADVLIGAVLVPGARAPYLVTEAMVKSMKPGSVILDISIDQGGCVETSRPTTPDNPTYKLHGVTHYCVPNMTANTPRAASRAMTLAIIPFLDRMTEQGLDGVLRSDEGLARGVCAHRGKIVSAAAARALGVEPARLRDLLGA